MVNKTKSINFSAFQFDLQIVSKTQSANKKGVTLDYTIHWDSEFVDLLLKNIFSNAPLDRRLNIKDEWFVLLEEYKSEDEYVYGKFQSALYGTVNNLVHADTLESRTNPKQKREGEESHSHFIIRKKDGLMLIQTTHRKVNRNRIESYIEEFGKDYITSSSYDNINICSLISNNFFEDIRQLDTVKSTVVEISAEEKSDENEFVETLQKQVSNIKGTHVSLEFKAKYQRDGLASIIPFMQQFKGKRGVTAIKVVGEKDGSGKTFNIDTYSESYKRPLKVDTNNNPISSNVYDELIKICKSRKLLTRGE